MNTVFISYGRRHSKEFAANLHKELIKEKFDVWFDIEDIPPGVDFREQIDHGIEIADNFIFIISPHAILSEYCLSEINTAVRYGKRIIPLLHVMPSDSEIKQMHPVVEKLNWIYFDSASNLDQSYKQLFAILNSHKEYVHTHTSLLSKALKWSKNPSNTSLLLFDDERIQAEQWLKTEFGATDNTSCRPSEFHADFICESKENAELHSGEVFFCYSDENEAILQEESTTESVPFRIHKKCQLNAITTWTRTTDTYLSTATDENAATGIEQCNVFLFFLNKTTLVSDKRISELELAIRFNKKIIPVEIEKINPAEIPSTIKNLKPIRFQFANDTQFEKSFRKLYAEILTDYAFIQLHTKYLTRAIVWNKQNRNSALLLKNFELEVAQNWLTTANKRQSNLPVELHVEFISASAHAIGDAPNFEIFMLHANDAFDFSSKIVYELRKFDKSVWVQKENIDSTGTEEFKYTETIEGMEVSDNILIIGSENCNTPELLKLIDHAVKLNKRIVLLNYKAAPDSIKDKAAAEIDFSPKTSDFKSAIIELIRILNLDRDYLHSHTLWLQKANAWNQFQQKQEYLLRGTEFQLAETWLQKALAEGKKPQPSEIQIKHITESKQQLEKETRRKKRNVQILRGLLAGISVLFILSVIFGINSLKQKNLAESAHIESNRNYLIAKSNNLQILAKEIEKNDPTKAFAISIAAIEADSSAAAKAVIDRIYYANNFYTTIFDASVAQLTSTETGKIAFVPLSNTKIVILTDTLGKITDTISLRPYNITALAYAADDKKIAIATDDNTIHIFDATLKETQLLKKHNANISALSFSKSGNWLVSGSWDNTIILWNNSGEAVQPFIGHTRAITDVCFSNNEKMIASASTDQTYKIWNLSGKVLNLFPRKNSAVKDVEFSPDDKYLVAATDDKEFEVRDINGKLIALFSGHTETVNKVGFLPENNSVYSSSYDNTIRIWDLQGNLQQTLKGHTNKPVVKVLQSKPVKLISFAEDDGIKTWELPDIKLNVLKPESSTFTKMAMAIFVDSLFVAKKNGEILLLSHSGRLLNSFKTIQSEITALATNPTGKLLAVGFENGMVHVYETGKPMPIFITELGNSVKAIGIHGTKKLLLASTGNEAISMFDLSTKKSVQFREPNTSINSLTFSADAGSFLYSFGSIFTNDNGARLVDISGNSLAKFRGHKDIVTLAIFAQKRQSIITASNDDHAYIWDLKGKIKYHVPAHFANISAIAASRIEPFLLATASEAGTIHLLSTQGELLKVINDSHEKILNLAFSSKNNMLISLTENEIRFRSLKQDHKSNYTAIAHDELDFEQKIDYGIISFQDLITKNDLNELIMAANYYAQRAENANSVTDEIRLLETSIELYKAANKTAPSRLYDISIAKLYYKLAEIHIDLEEYEKAVKTANAGLKADPTELIIYSKLALAYLYDNKTTQALYIYNKFKNKAIGLKSFKQLFIQDLEKKNIIGKKHEKYDEIMNILTK